MIQELQVGQMNRALRTVSLGYMYTPCTPLTGKCTPLTKKSQSVVCYKLGIEPTPKR